MAMRADRNPQTPTNGRRIPDHHPTADASTPQATDNHPQTERTKPDALKLLLKQFRELGGYFSYYLTVKADGAELTLRGIGLWIVLSTLGFVAVAGLIITASWLLLIGIAEGLGILFGDRAWVGNGITGFLMLASLVFGIYYKVASGKKTSRERTFGKHENRQARQQEQFGRDVSDQAVANTSEKK